jgi:protocatechuate 3,4-dioxygenase beta subunit
MRLAGFVLAVLASVPTWAQNTVTVSGRVTDGSNGLPIEGAAVALSQGGTGYRQMHYTDAGGNYSFDEVAPGAASVDVTASGFIAFQKTNPDEASIQVAADRAEHNFRLTAAAAITGRISGDGGVDRNIAVTLLREDFTDGVRHFVAGTESEQVNFFGMPLSGADGTFEIRGLEPGRYIVGAGPRAVQSYVLASGAGGKVAVTEKHPADGYVQTYYPGTTEFADSIPIVLRPGETFTADFKVARRPLFRASGEISALDAEPWDGTINIVAAGEGVTRAGYSGKASVPGAFVVEGLPAGQYRLDSVRGQTEAVRDSAGLSFSLWTMRLNLAFAITDHDVTGLRAVPEPGGQVGVNGFFRMVNGSDPLPAGLSVRYSYPQPGGQSDAIPVSDSGLFWLTGAPGEYSVQPLAPAGYAVTEVRYGGANYLNSLLPLKGEAPITILLSNQPGSVTGSVTGGDGKPVACRIALVPYPAPAGFDFRAIRVVKDDDQGAFVFRGLAPGRYKAVALAGDDQKRDHDLALLGDRLRTADVLEVAAGQSASIVLRP